MNSGLAEKRSFIVVLGLLSGLVATSIDMSLPAIPGMVRDLATSMSLGQQTIGLFMAGIAIGQLPAGLLSDRLGRMPVLYAGMGIFVLSGVVASVSDNIHTLLMARLAQGVGVSAGMVVSRAIIRDIASGATAARLMSLQLMIFTAAPMFAPMIGSFLVTHWGWRAPFFVLVILGIMAAIGIRVVLQETHIPGRDHHILRQLIMSLKEFFSHRRSIFGAILVFLPACGFMSLISGSSALVIEIYGYPVEYFGFIFALSGVSILTGSVANRRLLLRFAPMQVMGVGAGLVGIAAAQMLLITWLADVPFWWVWGSACLYMFGISFLMPNATALALDPVPGIAGVAASIMGTIQGIAASFSAIAGGFLYDGTITNITTLMGVAGSMTFAAFLLRKLILGNK